MKKKDYFKLGIYSFIFGTAAFFTGRATNPGICELENKIDSLVTVNRLIGNNNMQLHLELIKRDNPYGWELYGDELGNWGYRRPGNFNELGTAGNGYEYLK